MKQKITNYIRAGYSGLCLVSPEEQRVEAEIKAIADQLKYALFFWSAVDGLVDTKAGTIIDAQEPLEALQAIEDQQKDSIFLLRDFHLFMEEMNPVLLRKF